jgi:hypothetical protein
VERMTYIYGLLCPLEDKVRYVGQSVRPLTRCKQHVDRAAMYTDRQNAKDHWLCSLQEQGLEPALVILEKVEGRKGSLTRDPKVANRIDEAERRWIKRLGSSGHPLTNVQRTSADKQALADTTERGRKLAGALGVSVADIRRRS